MWRDPPSCTDVAPHLAAAIDDTARLSRQQRRHAERCLRCQAETVRYRKLLRALHGMRTDTLQPAAEVLPYVLAGLDEADQRQDVWSLLSGRRAAYVGGVAAAAAGAVSAILVTASRTRRTRLAG